MRSLGVAAEARPDLLRQSDGPDDRPFVIDEPIGANGPVAPEAHPTPEALATPETAVEALARRGRPIESAGPAPTAGDGDGDGDGLATSGNGAPTIADGAAELADGGAERADGAAEPVERFSEPAERIAAPGGSPRQGPRDQPGHGRGGRGRNQGQGGPSADQGGDEGRPAVGVDGRSASGGQERHSGCTAAQLRRFIKSRSYIPIHEIRRRFLITIEDDDVAGFDGPGGRLYVGLPGREAQMLADLLRSGDVGCELQHDPVSPVVVGVFPMRPITRQ